MVRGTLPDSFPGNGGQQLYSDDEIYANVLLISTTANKHEGRQVMSGGRGPSNSSLEINRKQNGQYQCISPRICINCKMPKKDISSNAIMLKFLSNLEQRKEELDEGVHIMLFRITVSRRTA